MIYWLKGQLFPDIYIDFPKVFVFLHFFKNIRCWFNIPNIILYCPVVVHWNRNAIVSTLFLYKSFLLGLSCHQFFSILSNFTPLFTFVYIYIYIYIYIYVCVCVCVCVCVYVCVCVCVFVCLFCSNIFHCVYIFISLFNFRQILLTFL